MAPLAVEDFRVFYLTAVYTWVLESVAERLERDVVLYGAIALSHP